jgi:hypothetical protein
LWIKDKSVIWIFAAFMGVTVLVSAPIAWATDTNVQELTKRLFRAVTANNLAAVRSSISAGANITDVNQEGLTAAGLAIEKGYFTVAHYILGVRNQKAANQEDNPTTALQNFPTNSNPPAQNAPETQLIPMRPPIVAPTFQNDPPAQAAKLWPANKPNPFSPNTQSGSIPIIGSLQNSTVQPVVPNKTVTSKLREQPIDVAPLKTPNTPAPREIVTPTEIQPLSKDVAKGSDVNSESKGVLDKMVDGVTDVFKSNDTQKPVTQTPASQAKPKAPNVNEDAPSEDGVIDRVWNSITNIF